MIQSMIVSQELKWKTLVQQICTRSQALIKESVMLAYKRHTYQMHNSIFDTCDDAQCHRANLLEKEIKQTV